MNVPWLGLMGLALVVVANFLAWIFVVRSKKGFDRQFPGRRRQLNIHDRRFVDVASPFRRNAQMRMMLTAAENGYLKRSIGPAIGFWGVLTVVGVLLIAYQIIAG